MHFQNKRMQQPTNTPVRLAHQHVPKRTGITPHSSNVTQLFKSDALQHQCVHCRNSGTAALFLDHPKRAWPQTAMPSLTVTRTQVSQSLSVPKPSVLMRKMSLARYCQCSNCSYCDTLSPPACSLCSYPLTISGSDRTMVLYTQASTRSPALHKCSTLSATSSTPDSTNALHSASPRRCTTARSLHRKPGLHMNDTLARDKI